MYRVKEETFIRQVVVSFGSRNVSRGRERNGPSRCSSLGRTVMILNSKTKEKQSSGSNTEKGRKLVYLGWDL